MRSGSKAATSAASQSQQLAACCNSGLSRSDEPAVQLAQTSYLGHVQLHLAGNRLAAGGHSKPICTERGARTAFQNEGLHAKC